MNGRGPSGRTRGPDAKGRGRGRGERRMVPDADFTSYYGRPILKAAPWSADIPAYLFLGGLAAGSSLLAAGADLTDRPSLRRTGRLGALGGISLSFAALVHDLGRPSRLGNMLRVAKPTSPMSVGTWILSAFGPGAGLAGAAELISLVPGGSRLPALPRPVATALARSGRPAGLGAALFAPAVASYTAVLLADTATPAWHGARHELPFVFVGSAAAASGGLGLLGATVDDAGPARRLAVGGALLEAAAELRMERSLGLAAETLRHGRAGRLMRAAKVLSPAGAALAVLGRRSRLASAAGGVALLAGSAFLRFGIFEAGQASAHDPKYTVVPQRARVDGRAPVDGQRTTTV